MYISVKDKQYACKGYDCEIRFCQFFSPTTTEIKYSNV